MSEGSHILKVTCVSILKCQSMTKVMYRATRTARNYIDLEILFWNSGLSSHVQLNWISVPLALNLCKAEMEKWTDKISPWIDMAHLQLFYGIFIRWKGGQKMRLAMLVRLNHLLVSYLAISSLALFCTKQQCAASRMRLLCQNLRLKHVDCGWQKSFAVNPFSFTLNLAALHQTSLWHCLQLPQDAIHTLESGYLFNWYLDFCVFQPAITR